MKCIIRFAESTSSRENGKRKKLIYAKGYWMVIIFVVLFGLLIVGIGLFVTFRKTLHMFDNSDFLKQIIPITNLNKTSYLDYNIFEEATNITMNNVYSGSSYLEYPLKNRIVQCSEISSGFNI